MLRQPLFRLVALITFIVLFFNRLLTTTADPVIGRSMRAKFRVNRIERSETLRQDGVNAGGAQRWVPSELQTIVLAPVYGNGDPNHENTKFWNATPSGEIRLGTVNAEAARQFELGKEYYIDFTPAEPA